ncbi:MAG: hypothetical protein Q7S20_05240 [Gemmatimonadaceae bacterium]|nr:hypothetical protein [Gemmatimonadaceae bacterium]
MGPEILVPLGGMTMVVAIVVGRPMVMAWAKKIENESRRPPLPPEVLTRLERMEQSIDAIAVEVERISEGQRFTTKLLSEVHDAPAALPAKASSSSPATP